MSVVTRPGETKKELARRFVPEKIREAGPGNRLPSLRDLKAELNDRVAKGKANGIDGVSELPLRQALAELTSEGLIDSQQGRPPLVLSTASTRRVGLSKSVSDYGRKTSVEDMRPSFLERAQDGRFGGADANTAAKQLGLGREERMFLLDRVRRLHGVPGFAGLRWDKAYMPTKVPINLSEFHKEDSLMDKRERAGLEVVSRDVRFSAILAGEAERERLQPFLGSDAPDEGALPLLRIEQLTVGRQQGSAADPFCYEYLIAICGSGWDLTYRRA